MAAISIGEAIGEGFGLIRRQPLLVLAWGLVNTVWSLAVSTMMAPSMRGLVEMQKSVLASGAGTTAPSSAEMMAKLGPLMQFEGVIMLIAIVSSFVSIILNCAVFRAVLRPEARAFAYLRLGSAELMLFCFFVAAYFVLVIGMLIALIPLIIVAAIAGAAHAGFLGGLIVFLGVVGLLVLMVWIAVRLALVGPMTVQDGRFHFLDAWRLTRGHAGSLFAIGLVLMVIVIVVGIVGLVLTFAFGGAAVLGSFQNALRGVPQTPESMMPAMGVGFVVRYLIAVPISGCTLAIIGAPWARAYRDLAQPDVAATFS